MQSGSRGNWDAGASCLLWKTIVEIFLRLLYGGDCCLFLYSNPCAVFQVTFPRLIPSFSDEHTVCAFCLAKGCWGNALVLDLN